MKKILFIFAFIFNGSAHADEYCDTWSNYARQVMQNRQLNLDLSRMLQLASKMTGLEKEAKSIVIKAYETPLFSTEKNKERAVMEFKNRIMLECVKS